MPELDSSFAKLTGRQPSDAEMAQLYRVRDALGLQNNDALWLVLMSLQHYQGLYEAFPKLIAKAAAETLAGIKVTADAAARASAESVQADLAKAVVVVAQEVAHNVSRKRMWQWANGCVAVAFASIGLFGWYMHHSGSQSGYAAGLAAGYSSARDEKAAYAWSGTPEGKAAYRLAQAESINKLTKCDQPGWTIDRGVCYVKPAADGNIYGWKLPF